MSISAYLKDIGRGKDGARALSRAQAADLFGQVLDGAVSDLEVGAFCIAMRVKGETAEEMAGFLDATHARLQRVRVQGDRPAVVLPSYNGARKLPVLTPLLAALLAREGLPVLIHGSATDDVRVHVPDVILELNRLGVSVPPHSVAINTVAPGEWQHVSTEALLPGLARLLAVRRVVGLRNSAHSLVKLMNPCEGAAVIVGSYTHPEYLRSMGEVFALMGSTALLQRGTEGEPVADPRRAPAMEGFVRGERVALSEAEAGSLAHLPELPAPDAAATAAYIRDVLDGRLPVPAPIALQVRHITRLAEAATTAPA